MSKKEIPSWLEGQIIETPDERKKRLDEQRKRKAQWTPPEVSKEELAKRMEGFSEFGADFLEKMAEIKAGN